MPPGRARRLLPPLIAAVTLPALGAWAAAASGAAASGAAVVDVFWVASHRPLAGKVVAIDAGHGGFHGGVVRGVWWRRTSLWTWRSAWPS